MLRQGECMEHDSACVQKPVRVIAITAGKGGVGKSTVALNLAVTLAARQQNVVLMDADLGLGNLDIMLGLHPRQNLSHVVRGVCAIEDILVEGPCGVKIIPAASGNDFMAELSPVEHAGLINACNALPDNLDCMIIDTAAGISDTVLSFARSAQEVVVIVCDEPTSITDAYALVKVMSHRYGWTHFRVLANGVSNARDGRKLFDRLCRAANQFLNVHLTYAGAIPMDEHVRLAGRQQQPFVLAFPESPASRALKELAESIQHWPPVQGVGGNTSFFLERMVAKPISVDGRTL